MNIKNPKIIDAEGEWAGDIDQTRDSEEQDGVIVYNVVDGTYDGGNFEDTNFIVFNSEQIKSATDNSKKNEQGTRQRTFRKYGKSNYKRVEKTCLIQSDKEAVKRDINSVLFMDGS